MQMLRSIWREARKELKGVAIAVGLVLFLFGVVRAMGIDGPLFPNHESQDITPL